MPVEILNSSANKSPFLLLLQVNLLQLWRRLKSIREQSRLLTLVIVAFMAGYLVLAFWLFFVGLNFIADFPGLGSMLLERLLYLLFGFLFLLLLLSNLVISYTNLFRNREAAALLTLPVPAQTIVQWKVLESMLLASWAFLFLIAPFLVAYGLIQRVAWHFYLVTFFLMVLFIVLPGVAGAWSAMLIARYLHRRRFQVGTLLAGLVLIAGLAYWLKPEPLPDEMLEYRVLVLLDKMLTKTRIAQYPWLPSYWLSSGVMQWAEGALAAAVFFALVLVSNVLFFGYVSFTRTGPLFYDAASAVQSRSSVFIRWKWLQRVLARRRDTEGQPNLFERAINLLTWLGPDVRALMVKDARAFWRDTTQWGQSVMLFGLLAVYILNLRHFSQQLTNPFWINLVSFLNLGACALNLATLTTRFVYPQFSLEGKRLWIVGMAPLGLVRVVQTKFWMATVLSLAITLGLIWLSCQMLQLEMMRLVYFSAAVAVMTFTLTALAVGLGALYPNFKEENPSKIVSGFGGTFCLVLSFLYILASLALLAFGAPWNRAGTGSGRSVACLLSFLVLSAGLGLVPLLLGLRRVRAFES